MEVIYGVLAGCVISLIYSFGPAFFSLLQTSIHYGFRRAVPFPLGVNMSDITTVCLLLTVLSRFDMETILHNPYVVFIGGGVLVAFAVYFFTRPSQDAESQGEVIQLSSANAPKAFSVYLRGFAINFFNPLVWLYWVSIITIASGTIGIANNRMALFFVGVLITTVSLDVVKCKVASLLQRFLTARVLNLFNKIIGFILVGFAVFLVLSLLFNNK